MDERIPEVHEGHESKSAEEDSAAFSGDMAIVMTTGIFSLLATLCYCIAACVFLLDNGSGAVYTGLWAFVTFPVVTIFEMLVLLPINLVLTKSILTGVDAKILIGLKAIPAIAFIVALIAFLLVVTKTVAYMVNNLGKDHRVPSSDEVFRYIVGLYNSLSCVENVFP